jgi:hypothetical protein
MYLSNCCSAKVAYLDEKTMTGLCMGCCEHCEAINEEEAFIKTSIIDINKELSK